MPRLVLLDALERKRLGNPTSADPRCQHQQLLRLHFGRVKLRGLHRLLSCLVCRNTFLRLSNHKDSYLAADW